MTTEARVHECGCSGSMLRCAHFDREWLVLHPAVIKGGEKTPLLLLCHGRGEPRFKVNNHSPDFDCIGTFFDDEAAANAAFDEAVERLLRGTNGK